MASEVKRYRELGTLIRAARAELGARQMSLIEAQERELDPAELDVQIANLGCQIAEWKREYESLFRYIVGKEETALMFSVDCSRILDGVKAETIARTPAKGNGDSGSQFVNCLAR